MKVRSGLLKRRLVRILFLIAFIYSAAAKTPQKGAQMEIQVKEERTFECKNLPEVIFKYPEFVGWEVKNTEEYKGIGCIITISNPPALV